MPIVTNAIYVNGVRSEVSPSLDETAEVLRAVGGMAWIGLYRPTESELRSVAAEFGLHPLAVADALKGHQRPKIERYDDCLFMVLRPARYLDAPEVVEFGEVHLFVGKDFVITIRHAESPDLGRVRGRLEATPTLLALGPEAVLYAVLDQIVDEYEPVVAGLENDIDEIEDQVFGADPGVAKRIYELTREVIGFQRAAHPLALILTNLKEGFEKYEVDIELRRDLRDVEDHLFKVLERIDAFRLLLQNALQVHSTLATLAQNEEMRAHSQIGLKQNEDVKRISSWAAILFAPTLIGTIYGMNFDHMPELSWPLGYPLAVVGMIAMGVGLHAIFRRRGWL
ncbi:MAG: magnesium and cobalt transport protein CorA [Microbacteriaceae bacterium]